MTVERSKLRVGGVPEHFNLPIHLASEEGLFEEKSLQVDWTTFDGGTGQMCKALRENDVDMCILLTEGIIKDIIKGNPSRIISVYVNTPLTWGIHTGANNTLNHHSDIYDKRYAISRFGSGSHLMAQVDANSQGLDIDDHQFHVIGNLDGALQSLSTNETDVFYWEKYTTKVFVDKGILKRVGEFVTPWPCFVVAATNKAIAEKKNDIIRFLRVIHDRCDKFMMDNNSISMVEDRYDIKRSDAERWFHNTEWAIHGWVSDKMINSVIYNLKSASIINDDDVIPELIWKRD